MIATEPTPLRERVTNWLAILAILLAGVVWPPVFGATGENARAGTLYLCSMPCGAPTEALRQTTRIHAQVTGNVARVQVTQKFENPSDDWVEGFYVFPLSAGAAVDELEMLVGERRIRGEIKRKEDARATYEKAKSEGRRASLVDQERPNMFTTSVANIAPHSSITVEIAYLDTIPFRDGRYSLNLPLSITPRYTPGSVRDDGGVVGPSTPESVDAAVQNAQIEIDLEPGFPLQQVNSMNHPVLMETTGLGRRINLRSPTVPADRDFEMVWTPSVAPDTYASAFAERVGSDTYVLVSLMPPRMAAERTYKREVVFIIDTSGSMSGSSIEQARAALRLGVSRLQPGDTFNIIRFSNDATSLFPTSQPAVGVNLQSAVAFIDRLIADGGTEMRSALELAFSMPPSMDALRQIVFVTDGSVSNEAELVRLIGTRIGAARLFTVGIGGAPNVYFMREAAAAGRGSFTFIPQIEQVNERMSDLFRKLENPALVDLRLYWPAGAVATLASGLPSDVYAGDPLTVVAKLSSLPQGVIALNGRSGGGAWTRQLPLRIVNDRSGIAKLWARERIAELARQKNLGGDAAEAENQIVSLALEHHLVSDYTSLVAVDDTPVRPVGTDARPEQVSVSAPRGTPWANTTGFAKTATPAPLLLLIGLAALGIAFAIFAPVRMRARA
ncbi:MAG: marine proteobacterial sortase target protein [Gammaproteobacteria bacterium]